MTSVNLTTCTVRRVHCSLVGWPCPHCGVEAPRVDEAERTAIDVDLDHPVLLSVRVSVHRCARCGRYFRFQPPFLRPDAVYTNRVVAKAIHSVFQDRMAIRRVTARLARDFWVQPSEGIIRVWCRDYGKSLDFEEDYQRWVVESFSGVLCVDEVYQGRLALLLAVDPRAPDGDRLVGYQLVQGTVDAGEVEVFLRHLAEVGIRPDEVVTDGSALYPAVIGRVWPAAVHQLCLFHESRRVVQAVDEVRRAVAESLPREPKHKAVEIRGRIQKTPVAGPDVDRPNPRYVAREAGIAQVHSLRTAGCSHRAIARKTGFNRRTIRRWLEEETPSELGQAGLADGVLADVVVPTVPAPPAPWTRWDEVAEARRELTACRYLLLRRPDHLDAAERQRVEALLAGPASDQLKVARCFLEDWYRMWRTQEGGRPSYTEAHERHQRWRQQPQYQALPPLARVLRLVDEARFRSLGHFLRHADWEATSNAAERAGRRFRKWQGPHYNLRSPASLDAAIMAWTMIGAPISGDGRTTTASRSTRGRRPGREYAAAAMVA